MNFIIKLISIPKSFLFCLKVFDFMTAVKLPVLVKYNTKLIGLHKGCIKIENRDVHFGMIRISLSEGSIMGAGIKCPSIIRFGKHGTWFIKDRAWCSGFCVINVDGVLKTGIGFGSNPNFKVSCSDKIVIGDHLLIGWDVTIIDSDGHKIFKNEKISNNAREVIIGNHVWLCAHCSILKGAIIPDNCVVAYNSVVAKKINESHVIIGGNDGKILKKDINWDK